MRAARLVKPARPTSRVAPIRPSRKREAIGSGAFAAEIVPVPVPGKGGERIVDTDEHPLKVSPEKIPQLKPAFRADGTITAASASANADGAAALLLTRRSIAQREGLPILSIVWSMASVTPEMIRSRYNCSLATT